MLSACYDLDGGDNSASDTPSAAEAIYSGTWWVNDKQSLDADVKVRSDAFFFNRMPYEDILALLFPGKKITGVSSEGYVVPFEMKAYTDRTYLYAINPTGWEFVADIDGKECSVGIMFSPVYNVNTGSWGSYSRQNGVFTLFLRATSLTCSGVYGPDAGAVPVDIKLKFTSATPKK